MKNPAQIVGRNQQLASRYDLRLFQVLCRSISVHSAVLYNPLNPLHRACKIVAFIVHGWWDILSPDDPLIPAAIPQVVEQISMTRAGDAFR